MNRFKRTYTLSELKRNLKESAQEFHPVIGSGVESGNKENNKKALKDINKEVSEYDGGLTFKRKTTKIGDNGDMNKTTLDLDFDDEPSKEYKDRVKSQVHGYASKEHEDAHKDDDKDEKEKHETNKQLYKDLKDRADDVNKEKQDLKASGLQAREFDKDKFKTKDVYENKQNCTNQKMRVLNFKKTEFINENEIAKRIPDEYKTDGNVFKVKDKNGRTFVVEWTRDDERNMSFGSFKEQKDPQKELDRIHQLFEYNTKNALGNISKSQRVNEASETFRTMIDKATNDARKKLDEWNDMKRKENLNRGIL